MSTRESIRKELLEDNLALLTTANDAVALLTQHSEARLQQLIQWEAVAVVLNEPGHEGATYELASRRATLAELAAEAGVDVEVMSSDTWAVTEGAGLPPAVRDGLLAMFAYYDAHGLPVGTLPLRALLSRSPNQL